MNKMSEAINKKLYENFGGSWTMIVVKWPIGGLAKQKWYVSLGMIPTAMLITELIAPLFSEHDHIFGKKERKNVVHNKEKLKKNKKKP